MRSVILAATAGALAGITCGQNLPAPSAGTSEWRFGGQTGGVVERAFGPGELACADGPGGATSMVDVFTTTQAAGIPDIGGVDTPVLDSDRHINPLGYHVRPLTGQPTRFIASLQSSGAGGVMTHQVDLTAIPLTPPVAVVAGETWNFQAWYRDANPGPTSNFTTALSATFQ